MSKYPGVKPATSKRKNPETGIVEEVALPNKWRLFMCFTVNGKTHRPTEVVEAKTIKQAYDYKVHREKELEELALTGFNKSKSNKMDFNELVKEWKAVKDIEIIKGEFSPITMATYESTLDKYILPYFGDIMIANISPVTLVNYNDYIKREYSLSDKTIYNQMMQLRGILSFAEDRGLIEFNPFTKLKKDKTKKTKSKSIQYFTDQQMVNILRQLDQDLVDLEESFDTSIKYKKLDKKERETRQNLRRLEFQAKRLFVHLAIVTGARRGELCGLRWDDLNDVSMEIQFNGSSYTLAGQKTTKKDTLKNGDDAKDVTLNALIIPVINEYKKLQSKVIRQQGWTDKGYIFLALKNGSVNKAGDPVRGDTFTQWFASWCQNNADKLGLSDQEAKEAHVHMLRHSSVSLLINSEAPIKAIAERAGHSDVRVTTQIYSHVYKDTNRGLADQFDKLYKLKDTIK